MTGGDSRIGLALFGVGLGLICVLSLLGSEYSVARIFTIGSLGGSLQAAGAFLLVRNGIRSRKNGRGSARLGAGIFAGALLIAYLILYGFPIILGITSRP